MKRTLLITGVVALVLTATTVLHAKDITVRGKLQKTAEAGGWLIAASDAKYLILNAKNYQSNAWFKESTNVEAVGETKDVMTTFMEGTPFEAKSMQPLEQNVATPGRDDNRRVTRPSFRARFIWRSFTPRALPCPPESDGPLLHLPELRHAHRCHRPH